MAYILEILRKPGLIRVCLHYNMNQNAIRFILAVPAEHLKRATTICYTTTSFTFKYEVDKLEQSWATVYKEYCQSGSQKKNMLEKTQLVGKKNWLEIWVGAIPYSLESSSYEGHMVRTALPIFTKHVFQQSVTLKIITQKLLLCCRNILFPTNSHSPKCWKFQFVSLIPRSL